MDIRQYNVKIIDLSILLVSGLLTMALNTCLHNGSHDVLNNFNNKKFAQAKVDDNPEEFAILNISAYTI